MFNTLVNNYSFFSLNRFYWPGFLTSLIVTFCSLVFAYYISAYSEAKVICAFQNIKDEKQIISISCKANAITYILISGYIINNLYYDALTILL